MRTILVDDHAVYRIGLRIALERMGGVEVVGEATTEPEARALATRVPFDIAIVDLHLAEGNGVDLTRWLRATHERCRVIAVSGDCEPMTVTRVVQAGAHGFCPKTHSLDTVIEAVQAIASGKTYLPDPAGDTGDIDRAALLSPREREILEHLCSGQSNDDIATALFVSRRTVETHRQRVMNKLGAHTIADLVTLAGRLGIPGG